MVAIAPLSQFDMRGLLDDLARELVLSDVEGREGMIALPAVYPGGSAVVVRVQRDDDAFIVHDGGEAHLAAEHLGGASVFRRIAPNIAKARGVEFDGRMFFKARVTREWLANMVVFIGDASRRSVEQTAERLTEERISDRRQRFRDRLVDTFKTNVILDIERAGQSGKPWHFTGGVQRPGHLTLFDFVTSHSHSINGAVTRFQDVISDEVRPIAALPAFARTPAHDIALLSKWAKVISADTPGDQLRLAA